MDVKQRLEIIQVALGQAPADLVIKNGTMVNVYTAEVQPDTDVAVKGERIAYVGPDARAMIGPDTVVIDASGKVVAPGFIDAHTHVDGWYTVGEYMRFALPTGTTTTVTDTSIMSNALGYDGVIAYLENTRRQPANIYATVQAMTPPTPPFETSVGLTGAEVKTLLALPEMVGLGETFWPRLLEGEEELIGLLHESRSLGKPIEGHTAGAKGDRLIACAAAGIDACHEPISIAEVMERVRAGMHVMIRDGSLRHDLETIAPIKDYSLDFRRLVLITDGYWPEELLNQGLMDSVVQKAIDLGFDPVKAIQMVTLNPAEHLRLDGEVGGIAPGRLADILVLPDLRTIRCERVICRGRIVAQDGRLLVDLEKDRYPSALYRSMRIRPSLAADDFRIPINQNNGRVRARAIRPLASIILGEALVDAPVLKGSIRAAAEEDLAKIAVINRYRENGPRFVGLMKGYGIKTGAIGTSLAWDCYQLTIVGADEEDMARVANRLITIGGGAVAFDRGELIAEFPMPIGGIISDLPMEEVRERFRQIQRAARRLGITHPNPFLSLQTLTFTPLPYFRVTESGLLDIVNRRIVETVLTE